MTQVSLREINFCLRNFDKDIYAAADLQHMISSVSSSHTSQASEVAKPATPKSQPQQAQQKSSPQPSDTVKLKSTGDASHEGDSK